MMPSSPSIGIAAIDARGAMVNFSTVDGLPDMLSSSSAIIAAPCASSGDPGRRGPVASITFAAKS